MGYVHTCVYNTHTPMDGTNGCHLTFFSEDVAFARHFMAIRPFPSHPTPVNKLSKMAGNSANYPLNSW